MARRSGVTIELDRERRLKYPMSVVREIEERFDIDIMAGEQLTNVTFDDAMWIVWLGLRHELPPEPTWRDRILALLRIRPLEEPITQAELEEIIGMDDIEGVMDSVQQALGFRKSEDEKKKAEAP